MSDDPRLIAFPEETNFLDHNEWSEFVKLKHPDAVLNKDWPFADEGEEVDAYEANGDTVAVYIFAEGWGWVWSPEKG